MSPTHSRVTCGDFGGRNAQGKPCGVSAVDGPCTRHTDQVNELSKDVVDTTFHFMTPPFKRTKDKCCIVGFTGHRDIALTLDRDEWEVWGLNELYRYMPVAGFDRWFEIHGREYLEKDEDGKKHMHDLASMSIPIYMQQRHEDIPASVKFPLDEMIEQLGSDYFTNCPAYMTAFAIAMGFEEILITGVDMAQDTEYAVQRPCCEYWIGVGRGKGINVRVPDMSDLMKCAGLYGYDDKGAWLSRKLNSRLKWLHEQDNERLKVIRALEHEYEKKRGAAMTEVHRGEGAVAELEGQRKTDKSKARIAEIQEMVDKAKSGVNGMQAEYNHKHGQLMTERNQLVGGIQDVNYIIRSLLPKADSIDGGNIPTQAERAADPMTGIQAPSGDSKEEARELVTV